MKEISETDQVRIPSVDFILNHPLIKTSVINDAALLKKAVKDFIAKYKELNGIYIEDREAFIIKISQYLQEICISPIKQVINATGTILHTNLGRAPLSEYVLKKSFDSLTSYTNIEFNLENGERGNRNSHLRLILQLITGAEDCLIVNNNAAAVFLCLNQFAKDKEVIISRSELIEIGGSFRIPDIMRASGCLLQETGTTNCTRLADYEQMINENTGLIFKAHQSNFYISGHTQSVDVSELSVLARQHNIPFIYDMGSGLINHVKCLEGKNEPNVKDCLAKGADLITFSGDKLLGGPQCGIIAGKKILIDQLAKNPLMRILRVDKLTLRILFECLTLFLNENDLLKYNPLFKMLVQTENDLKNKATRFSKQLLKSGISNHVLKTVAFTGGGTLPELQLASYEVQIESESTKAEYLYRQLMKSSCPVVAVLKEGRLSFNMMTLNEKELITIHTQLIKLFFEVKP